MKVYKTVITYEMETISDHKPDAHELEQIRHNIEINLSRLDRLNSQGRLAVCSEEIEI